MRILVYGLQSSGASTLAYLLAQVPRSYAIVDQYCMHPLPQAECFPPDALVIAKTTVSTCCPLEQHCEAFRPHRRILVIRHPHHNYISLMGKRYANLCGTLADKFREIERVFINRGQFDAVLRFEDMVFRRKDIFRTLNQVGISLTAGAFDFVRSIDEIGLHTCSIPILGQSLYKTWGFGNIRGDCVRPSLAFKWIEAGLRPEVSKLCPTLASDYDGYMSRTGGAWGLESAGAIYDVAGRTVTRARQFVNRARRRLRRWMS